MAKQKTQFICQECGHSSVRWLGRCPMCKIFDTFEEEDIIKETKTAGMSVSLSSSLGKAVTLEEIDSVCDDRLKTNLAELDRVLSGGVVKGSLTLVGGEPGIGKSTLLLQICESYDDLENPILYVSGEESLAQIKLRAKRLGIKNRKLFLLSETRLEVVQKVIKQISPCLVIIDSIQTMHMENVNSGPGSITQIKGCTGALMHIAKVDGISVFIVGHVTKEGSLSGPKVLEHMVDTVLYFEGEKRASYRIIRSVKNRFGSTDEIGVFEMREEGLIGITNPSEYMLSGRPLDAPGSVVTCTIEGTRPILTEVQSLICYTNFGMPRRAATGMDYNRVVMLIAMLEKRAGLELGNYDAYMNIAGGLRINEPAVDLAAVAAIISSYRNRNMNPHTVIFGEVGLTGEVRAVNMAERRVAEAAKLGFRECIMPQGNMKGLKKKAGINVLGVANVNELLNLI